jgi:hypothetical protein
MKMAFKQRITVLGILALLFLAAYGAAKAYSPAIVAYVVEQALVQKAPEGMSPILVRERFQALLASTPGELKMLKLLALSNYLEKVQKLTPAELNRLLRPDGTAAGTKP